MILFRYIGREILKNFLGSLLVLNGLLLLTRFTALLVTLASEHLTQQDYLRLFIYLASFFLTFTIPLAALVGVVLSFMRLSQDQEILAFESLGIPFRRLMFPVLLLSLIATVCTFIVTIKYLPWSKRALRNLLFELTERKIARGIPAKTFVNWIPNLSIFAQKAKHQGKNLALVFMLDETDPKRLGIIFASRGKLEIKDHKVVFRLFDGCIHLVSKDYTSTEELRFKEYIYRIDLAHFERKRGHSRGELSLTQLKKRASRYPPGDKRRVSFLIEYWKRLAFPWAALVLTLLGAPLGAMMRASGRGIGLALASFLFLSYYFLFSGATNLAQKQILPIPVALNLPNLIFLILVIFFVQAFERGKIGRAK